MLIWRDGVCASALSIPKKDIQFLLANYLHIWKDNGGEIADKLKTDHH